MDWFKKHVDTVIVLGGILASVMWMNGKFNHSETEMNIMKTEMVVVKASMKDLNFEMKLLSNEVCSLKNEVSIMKTVMIMKNIMPSELAHGDSNKEK